MKIRNARFDQIFIPSFRVKPGQSWCVIGANRSGIRAFFDLVCGKTETVIADTLELSGSTGWVSFKEQQQIYEQELKNDDTDYLDRPDPGTLGRDFLTNTDAHLELIEAFGMTACLNKGYRRMSTGQTRKLLILSQITKGNSTLIIQAPFEGLDVQSRKEVNRALEHLHTQQVNLLLFVHNPDDIPFWCSHLALVSDGQLAVQGPLSAVRQEIETRMVQAAPDFNVSAADLFKRDKPPLVNEPGSGRIEPPEDGSSGVSGAAEKVGPPEELVHLENGTAGYDGTPVFNGVSLEIRRGDHTLVTGPNGCGKSTLLHMITGDHPACYQNNLRIFNIQRGTGESIWELKKRMGIVSPELHRNYHIPGPVIHCIISGLFDSIGLYQPYSPAQQTEAEKWLGYLGMADKAGMPFRELTFADQRLVLIARALIKRPALLILDEPTQGLDAANRKALLDFLEEMTQKTTCTILYVSHREDEYRPFFVRHLQIC